jgi:hypothetical protein
MNECGEHVGFFVAQQTQYLIRAGTVFPGSLPGGSPVLQSEGQTTA